MKRKLLFTIILLAALSGCGIVHNSLHPYPEHCLYHCYKDAVEDHLNSKGDCFMNDQALTMMKVSCDLKCIE